MLPSRNTLRSTAACATAATSTTALPVTHFDQDAVRLGSVSLGTHIDGHIDPHKLAYAPLLTPGSEPEVVVAPSVGGCRTLDARRKQASPPDGLTPPPEGLPENMGTHDCRKCCCPAERMLLPGTLCCRLAAWHLQEFQLQFCAR